MLSNNQLMKEEETSLVSYSEAFDQEETIESPQQSSCTNQTERYWNQFSYIPHVSNISQPSTCLDSNNELPRPNLSMIEKPTRKSQRLLHNRSTGRLIIPTAETLSSLVVQPKPLLIPDQIQDVERKPPSIKEERRRAKERYQLALLETIRNQPNHNNQAISARRVLIFNDE